MVAPIQSDPDCACGQRADRPIMPVLVHRNRHAIPCGRNACITAAIAGSSLAQDHTGRLCENLAAPQAKIGTKDLLDGVQKQRMARKL